MGTYFRDHGIVHKTSCTGTPQQNGRVERKHRHILNVARALCFQANLPIHFWGDCALTACYLINRTSTIVLKGKSPYELLYGTPPTLNHLRVLGCLCYAHNQHHGGDKFASRSRKCIFMGYPYGKKAWRLYDIESKTFFVSRDVVFYEADFPYASTISPEHNSSLSLVPSPSPSTVVIINDDLPLISQLNLNASPNIESDSLSSISLTNDFGIATVRGGTPDQMPTEDALGRGHRIKIPSTILRDYVTNTIRKIDLSPCSSTLSSSSGTPYPIANYVSCTKFSSRHRQFLAAITKDTEP